MLNVPSIVRCRKLGCLDEQSHRDDDDGGCEEEDEDEDDDEDDDDEEDDDVDVDDDDDDDDVFFGDRACRYVRAHVRGIRAYLLISRFFLVAGVSEPGRDREVLGLQ